jgi:hypothetical protein
MSTQSNFRAFKEITSWDDLGYKVPNHTYILDNQGHCVGFRSTTTKTYKQFNKPMKTFSKSRRKFIELFPVEKYMLTGYEQTM